MPKAIVVTEANKSSLETQYDLEMESLSGFEGLILVADFGSSQSVYGYLNKVAFDKSFVATGAMLENGYFEVQALRP